jgi:hypothetical protein
MYRLGIHSEQYIVLQILVCGMILPQFHRIHLRNSLNRISNVFPLFQMNRSM